MITDFIKEKTSKVLNPFFEMNSNNGKNDSKELENFIFLNTDFYQISMGFVYVVMGKNFEKTGFEGFVRNIKKEINPNEDFYIFDGEEEVKNYIEDIKKELENPKLLETFISLIESKITANNKEELILKFRENWNKIDKNFEFTIIPNGTMIKPYVPVFQFYGDKFIGQVIETYVTNIYNGRTALKTLRYLMDEYIDVGINEDEYRFLEDIMNGEVLALEEYKEILRARAKEFRESTNQILLEAAFRRAPNKVTADMASQIALEEGWDGTSNVSLRLTNKIKDNQIGGTMAHAFVMSFENENEAFIAWNKIFPGTTMLIDTYDVKNAMINIHEMSKSKKILGFRIPKKDESLYIEIPNEVRLDSDPMQEYIDTVKNINTSVGIFASGDMTPEKLIELSGYTKAMAGTKYVYSNELIKKLNSGFVYKIVEYHRYKKTDMQSNGDGSMQNYEIIKEYPEKKSTGKSNYPGLKHMVLDESRNTLDVYCKTPSFGYRNIHRIDKNTKINFIVE